MKSYLYLLLATIFFISCKNKKTVEKATPEVQQEVVEIDTVEKLPEYPFDRKFNDLSNYLAGKPGNDSSTYKPLEDKAEWNEYCVQLEQIWKKTNSKIPVMQSWANDELSGLNSQGGTLFYPFSGPDFLHADIFFPNYDTIIMMGLEPIGTYPDLFSLEEDTLAVYLSDVKKSLNAILGLSFFRTVAMADDFRSSLDGVLPLFLQFINKTGHELLYQENVMIMPDGSLSTDLSEATGSSYIGNRYYFRKEGEDKVRVLIYFAVNLQNTTYYSRGGLAAKGLDSRTDLVRFIKNSRFKTTYLKSASYLMHRPSFSIIRNLILDNSTYLLQDDSGIPVADFDREKWDLKFYGSYLKPISLFSDRVQEDLKRIYEGDSVEVYPLPFGIGYQFHNGSSNLMRATKKTLY